MWCEILVRKREKSFTEEDPNLEDGCKVATVGMTWAFSSPATVHDEGMEVSSYRKYMYEREREREKERERERGKEEQFKS